MKVFLCSDDDGGRESLVIAEDIKTAIRLFEMVYEGVPPDRVFDLTTDDQTVIIEGITTPYLKEYE